MSNEMMPDDFFFFFTSSYIVRRIWLSERGGLEGGLALLLAFGFMPIDIRGKGSRIFLDDFDAGYE